MPSEMQNHTAKFASVTQAMLEAMFDADSSLDGEIQEMRSVDTQMDFKVSIFYTGTVYGEYMLAMDEKTAAGLIGAELDSDYEDDICDAVSETLNTIVGESIVELQEKYAKLTLTAPRIYRGAVRYPNFHTGKAVLNTEHGPIECHFCLDLMRLDLAASYNEAMSSLLNMNEQLKAANKNLAEQQAQLVLAEKMASVGVLASGLAHEINNPLFFVDANLSTLDDYVNVIDSSLQLYENLVSGLGSNAEVCPVSLDKIEKQKAEQDLQFVLDDTKDLVKDTRDGVLRIQTIVQGLKDFSHVDRAGLAEVQLEDIIETSKKLVSSSLPEDAQITLDLSDLPAIICHAGEIGQALTSILLNACQAISTGGSIGINAEADKDAIKLSIQDDGVGIPTEDIPKVFDPFFTTKEVGDGTGLGLSIAYRIFEKHNGGLKIESQAGKGTTVTIHLPIRSAAAQETAQT